MVTSPQPTNSNAKERRILLDRALAAAKQGDWHTALEANQQLVASEPNAAATHNRLGKALSELGRFREAYEAYHRASELEPHNTIAQRNLHRLEAIKDQPDGQSAPRAVMHPYHFIEETGKTINIALAHPADRAVRAQLLPGDVVELRVDRESGSIAVYTPDGTYLGLIEPRIGERMVELMAGGNRYSAAIVAHEEDTVRLLVREVYQGAGVEDRMSFPTRVRGTAPRAYIRKDMLFDALDEADLLADEEEEGEAEEETEETEIEDEEFTEDDLDDSRI